MYKRQTQHDVQTEALMSIKNLQNILHILILLYYVFQSANRLTEPTTQINIIGDLETVVSLREAGQPVPEQLLPDFYAEHITLAMNKERRRQVCDTCINKTSLCDLIITF